jgi:hypothetical protein
MPAANVMMAWSVLGSTRNAHVQRWCIRSFLALQNTHALRRYSQAAHSCIYRRTYDSLVSSPGCLAGTREKILAQMITWVDEPRHSMSICWLAGLAGTGNSAIAKVYEQLTDKGILTAAFFMPRISAERRNLFNIKLK